MNLLLRADASCEIGTGHVMRCIALGQAWQDAGGCVTFVLNSDNTALKTRIAQERWRIIEVPQSYPHPLDISTTLGALVENQRQWMALDGYGFDCGFQEAVRATGCRLLVIDDFAHAAEYCADVILNQNADAENYSYRCNEDAVKLLGSKYCLLRRDFGSRGQPERPRNGGVVHLLATLGGSDPLNVTEKAIMAVRDLPSHGYKVRILVGHANPRSDPLRQLAAQPGEDIEILDGADDMPGLMAWADIAISAGGSTCWELCFSGVPMILTIAARNQEGIVNELVRRGAAVSVGAAKDMESSILACCLRELCSDHERRERMGMIAASLVDGKGAARVVEAMRKIT